MKIQIQEKDVRKKSVCSRQPLHCILLHFTNNDGSQNMFVYQTTPDTIELKKYKGIDYVRSWKSKGYSLLKKRHHLRLFLITQTFLDIQQE